MGETQGCRGSAKSWRDLSLLLRDVVDYELDGDEPSVAARCALRARSTANNRVKPWRTSNSLSISRTSRGPRAPAWPSIQTMASAMYSASASATGLSPCSDSSHCRPRQLQTPPLTAYLDDRTLKPNPPSVCGATALSMAGAAMVTGLDVAASTAPQAPRGEVRRLGLGLVSHRETVETLLADATQIGCIQPRGVQRSSTPSPLPAVDGSTGGRSCRSGRCGSGHPGRALAGWWPVRRSAAFLPSDRRSVAAAVVSQSVLDAPRAAAVHLADVEIVPELRPRPDQIQLGRHQISRRGDGQAVHRSSVPDSGHLSRVRDLSKIPHDGDGNAVEGDGDLLVSVVERVGGKGGTREESGLEAGGVDGRRGRTR